MVYNNEDKYYGDNTEGKRNGRGKYFYKNGDRYEGDWKNNFKDGFGKYYYNTGELYIGDWSENKRNGQGKFFYQNSDIYVGGWLDNQKHGEGTYYMQNTGQKFRGLYEYNKKNGLGYLINNDGQVHIEYWQNGTKLQDNQLSYEEAQKYINEFTENNQDDISNDNTMQSNQSNEENQEIDIEKIFQEYIINKQKKDIDDNDLQQNQQKYNIQYDGNDYDEPCEILDFEGNQRQINFLQENENDQIRIQTEVVESISYPNDLQSKDDIFAVNQGLNSQVEPPISESQDDRINIGYDTLNVIEQYDQLHSYIETIIDKPIQKWSEDDVVKWLDQINFSEYKQIFLENNINGNNLFSLTENDLKLEFGMTKVGIRKDFMKNIQLLKEIYSKNPVQSKQLEEKLQKIISIKKLKVKLHPNFSPMKYNTFQAKRRASYNNILSLRNDQKQLQEVIEERDELMNPDATTPTKNSLYLEQDEQQEDSELRKFFSAQNQQTAEEKIQLESIIKQNEQEEIFNNQNTPSCQNKKKRQNHNNQQSQKNDLNFEFMHEEQDLDSLNAQLQNQKQSHISNNNKKNHVRRSNDHVDYLDGAISNYNNSLANIEAEFSENNQKESISSPFILQQNQQSQQISSDILSQNTLKRQLTDAEIQKKMINLQDQKDIQVDQLQLQAQQSNGTGVPNNNNNIKYDNPTDSSSSSTSSSESDVELKNPATTPKLKKSITQLKKKQSESLSSSEDEKTKLDQKKQKSEKLKIRLKNTEQKEGSHFQDSKEGSPSIAVKKTQRSSQSLEKQQIELLKKKKYISLAKKQSRNQTQGLSYKSDVNIIMRAMENQGIGLNFLINYSELQCIEKIGEGGYGEVFKGLWLGKDVAIKQYGKKRHKFHKHRAIDFIKEVEVINNLRHPNIVLYMGVCLYQNQYLMITEFLEQGSLFDQLHKKHTKLTQEKCLAIAEDIALGLNYLHGRKVLHCDLKSSNVLIDTNWTVKLCDFGLSRIKSKINKKMDGRVGTPHWMAPEILRGEQYAEYSDVYSYGMILWEMLTAEIPYFGLSQTQIIGTVGYDNKHHLNMPKEGDPELIAIMKDCLNRDPQKRPQFKDIVPRLQQIKKSQKPINAKKIIIKELYNFFGD